ncbi:Protein-L-isoaspartate O-methyltransferase [wastewater metagenome]|uniref:protein-L-isoaspartate(D-aspartate) O-methyltransferase n=2 Tax=unclassified sequences TaxID=12908 RepID=A0A5B8R6V0_9ZZZZ|nr:MULTISPECIES: protein-L-isoaspartate(D-aspartate) O-methyltransferase [Arhodomonas]MCS4503223.1 protein-L-isoaspartate(D-aspartate) O-methyltransferase [Arhodomonas aquaeolei]QEA04759.1 protein-L-isoaspartate O-methyltransferase [uncultured organism]
MTPDQLRRGIGMTSQRTRERLVRRLGDAGIGDPRVLNVMRHIPRHLFVDEALASRAYEDTALPIGHGQTISQPFVVARMTEALIASGAQPRSVLEIGTGCGYQTAVLAALVPRVFTIERIRALYGKANAHLRELSVHNVRQRLGDGYAGWPSEAPFDAILLTAAPSHLPETLLEQLAPGGRLVAPIGESGGQSLCVYERDGEGVSVRRLSDVSFVPMQAGLA